MSESNSPSSPLKPRQVEFLRFLQGYREKHGRSPTFREVCKGLGFRSHNSAVLYLSVLSKMGFLQFAPGVARSIVLKVAVDSDGSIRALSQASTSTSVKRQDSSGSKVALTDRQMEVLGFIRTFIETNGFSPTITEICNKFGFSSPNGAYCHLRAIEKKGYLQIGSDTHRSIVLVEHEN